MFVPGRRSRCARPSAAAESPHEPPRVEASIDRTVWAPQARRGGPCGLWMILPFAWLAWPALRGYAAWLAVVVIAVVAVRWALRQGHRVTITGHRLRIEQRGLLGARALDLPWDEVDRVAVMPRGAGLRVTDTAGTSYLTMHGVRRGELRWLAPVLQDRARAAPPLSEEEEDGLAAVRSLGPGERPPNL